MRFLPSSWVRFLSLRDDAMPASLLAAFWPSSAAVRNTRSENDLAVMPSSRGPIIRPFQSIVARRANEASACCESGQGFPMRAGSMTENPKKRKGDRERTPTPASLKTDEGRRVAPLELLSVRWSAIIHESVRTKERGTSEGKREIGRASCRERVYAAMGAIDT